MSGSLSDIPLGFDDANVICGAGFDLVKPSPIDWDFTTSAGVRVVLRKDAASVVAHLPSAQAKPEDILEAGHDAAQEALDVLGMREMHFVGLKNAEYDHLLWWRDPAIVVRWCDVARLNVRIEASWEKTSAKDGSVTSSKDEPLPKWHEAMRYFRYSQLRDDLYAAYRDAYLALESILSTAAAPHASEGERVWHNRACRVLEAGGLDFAALAPTGGGDAVARFVDDQFKAHRCALFHAKVNQQHFLPGVLTDRRFVAEALERLGRFLTQAASQVLGASSMIGVVTYQGMKLHADLIAPGLELAVSDDKAPVVPEDTEISPFGKAVTILPTTYVGVVDGIGYDYGFQGEIPVPQLASTTINTTASRVPGAVMTRGAVDVLVVDGAGHFQYHMVLSFSSRAGLKGGFDL